MVTKRVVKSANGTTWAAVVSTDHGFSEFSHYTECLRMEPHV